MLRDIAFTEQWNSGDYTRLVYSLINTLRSGGTVLGAFRDGPLVGFAAVENNLFGAHGDTLELSYFHVTHELRGGGIGRKLFELSCESARRQGARKLYISAHSSEETQAFYRAMGCVEAAEPDEAFSEREPCDVQMEYGLSES
jgi:GNAT superfamily N-acetyltransferase